MEGLGTRLLAERVKCFSPPLSATMLLLSDGWFVVQREMFPSAVESDRELLEQLPSKEEEERDRR
uniref:Uncharacterized protein n=1 Tax=Amphimedon queenslandica TaxID=400682 RepID=A0A1X7VJ77_AMPQE